jgi:putative intracellular protease/amidase
MRSTVLLSALLLSCGPAATHSETYAPASISNAEHLLTIEAMKPPKRERPVVAVVALNEGTEVTDFMVPYGVLARSAAADVFAVAPDAGVVELEPAPLHVRPHMTLAEFAARYPDGADYVIVPKILPPGDDPDVVSFIRAQHATGSTIVSICAGALTVSATGLLEGRRATTHWYSIEDIREDNPTMEWVPDRRYVADDGIVSTTGVTASLPVSLALVEAIAGRKRAEEMARELGVASWDARHDSSAFYLDGPLLRQALENELLSREHTYGVPVADGVDDVALAFTTDAWSRTRRSEALTVADAPRDIVTAGGLVVVPDLLTGDERIDSMLPPPSPILAAVSLPTTLQEIADTYGDKTALFVAVQLEYTWRPAIR